MIDFPRRIPIDELDIRLKEWKLAGLDVGWTSAGTVFVRAPDEFTTVNLVRYSAGLKDYERRWRLPKKRIDKLLSSL